MSYTFDISIILVNYNGKKYIDNLMDSICKINHPDFTFETVFVDNNSSDDSVAYLRSKYQNAPINLKIVETGANLGFAGGNNAGVKACNGKYIVLLNNDTAVDSNWLLELYQFIHADKTIGMVNSKLLFFHNFITINFATQDKILLDNIIKINGQEYQIDNKFCTNLLYEQKELTCFGHSSINIPLLDDIADYTIQFRFLSYNQETDYVAINETQYPINQKEITISLDQQLISDINFALIQNAGSGINKNNDGYDIGFCTKESEKTNKPYEINNGCGASIMMLTQDFIEAGMFDERFFMYYEDSDLSYRIRGLGKKIMYCPTSIVRHVHTGSSTEWSPFFIYHVCRNKLLFIYKNISKWAFIKTFIIQYLVGIKYHDKMRKQGSIDAIKILFFDKDNINYENAIHPK